MSERRKTPRASPRQAAVIPVRRTNSRVEVCIIRRKGSSKWGIPKGFIDAGDSRKQAALNEAYEEAGLSGHVIGDSIGTYDYEKWDATLTVVVFLMEVLEEEPEWQEMGFRERRGCSLKEAAALLNNHRAWPLFDRIRADLETASRDAPLRLSRPPQ